MVSSGDVGRGGGGHGHPHRVEQAVGAEPVVDDHHQLERIHVGPLPDELGETLAVERVAHVIRDRLASVHDLPLPLDLVAGLTLGLQLGHALERAVTDRRVAGVVGGDVRIPLGQLLGRLRAGGTCGGSGLDLLGHDETS